jgi:hypothetical protein
MIGAQGTAAVPWALQGPHHAPEAYGPSVCSDSTPAAYRVGPRTGMRFFGGTQVVWDVD